MNILVIIYNKMQDKKLLIQLLLLMFVFSNCTFENDRISKLDGEKISFFTVDSIVSYAMNEAEIPGLQLAIFNNNKIKYIHSYGVKDSARNLPIDNNTVIQLASWSKSLFACLVMKLVEDSQFDLDKPIYEYLDFPLYELENSRFDYLDLKDDERYKLLTGRMLLSHTAGFRNYRNKDKLKIYFEPGSQYHYSGEGILILQGVIEHITKKSLDELMNTYVFNPIDMNHSSLVWDDKFKENVSFGFKWDGSSHHERKDSVAMAAYSGVSSISDFSKLIVSLLNNEFVSNAYKTKMFTEQHKIQSKNQFGNDALIIDTNNVSKDIELHYGLGWGILKTPLGKAFFKEGKNPGAHNFCIIFENGTGLIMMTNSDRGDQVFQYLNEKLIANNYFPWQWESIYPFYVHQIFDQLYEDFEAGLNGELLLKKYDYYNLKNDCTEYSNLILSALGMEYLAINKFDDAILIFEKLAIEYPTIADVYINLGKAYWGKQDLILTVYYYEKAYLLEPENKSIKQVIKDIRTQLSND